MVFSAIIDGRVYARRGTTFDTRLTVLDRGGDERGPIDPLARVSETARLLEAVSAAVPARLPIEPVPAVSGPARRSVRPCAGAPPGIRQACRDGPFRAATS